MKSLITLAVVLCALGTTGCAITDYSGLADHKTVSEAKLWGTEISFAGFGPALDGTYAYTVRYDNRAGQGAVTITSYRNPVVSSFSRDGLVDRDGDDVQGTAGDSGGKFLPYFVAVDQTGGGVCEFFANVTQDKSGGAGPLAASCLVFNEEIDKDFDLLAAFGSLDDLFGQIWSGALGTSFEMEITGLILDGTPVAISSWPIQMGHNGLRPISITVSNGAGAASAVQAILDHTQDGVPVHVGLQFNGGLTVNLPSTLRVAFDHDALAALP